MKKGIHYYDGLLNAVEGLHECKAMRIDDHSVKEDFDGEVVWEGAVSEFQLTGHPESDTCYAWSSPIDGSEKRKFYAVLKIPPIGTPLDAVRAAIVSDQKGESA